MKIKSYNAPVSENIALIIDEAGLKQKAVAHKAGLSVQTFNDMLNGRRIIKVADVKAIADALGVEPNDLYGIKETG